VRSSGPGRRRIPEKDAIPEVRFDCRAYLQRIGLASAPGRGPETLRALHRAHRGAIPFENLDIQLGRPIRLDLDSLQAKLVGARRGGYCFEQNTLFRYALRDLGFAVEPCEARVRPPGSDRITPRTHMVLVARVDETDWLVDVGFGGAGPLEPVALSEEPQDQHGWCYRIVRGEREHTLQLREAGVWRDLYTFVPEPRYPIDFEVANWYTSTHPESRFVITLTAQRSTPEAREVLHNLTYTRSTPSSEETREIGREELVGFLAARFGIELPADTRFRALDG
jgi:N-hydroxyarylamine O-acetyltransferase